MSKIAGCSVSVTSLESMRAPSLDFPALLAICVTASFVIETRIPDVFDSRLLYWIIGDASDCVRMRL